LGEKSYVAKNRRHEKSVAIIECARAGDDDTEGWAELACAGDSG
jgi:hypothetical protein